MSVASVSSPLTRSFAAGSRNTARRGAACRPISFFVGAQRNARVSDSGSQRPSARAWHRGLADVKWPPRHARTQTNARVQLVHSGATATAPASAGFRGPPRNESTLRRAAFPPTFSLRLSPCPSHALSFSTWQPRTALNEMSQVSYRSPS